jgi:hypothetical protein
MKKKIETVEEKKAELGAILKMPLRQALITQIRIYTLTATHLPDKEQAEIVEIAKFFEQHLFDITFSGLYPGEFGATITFSSYPNSEKVYSKIAEYLNHPTVMLALAQVTNTLPEFLDNIKNLNKREEELKRREHILAKKEKEQKKKEKDLERLTKQPRNLLKTLARDIGNTTEKPTLFSIENPELEVSSERDLITKNTSALAIYLIDLYQRQSEKTLSIENLAPLAEQCTGGNNKRLKTALQLLGGYTYPFVDVDPKTSEIVITSEQLFKIEFRYSAELGKKYGTNSKGLIQGKRIGNEALSFIENEETSSIKITPSERLLKGLEGKGLGNTLVVSGLFIELMVEATDIASKILTFSSSNKPSYKIHEDKLIDHLGLSKQVKTQGKPRVRETILKGLQELKEKEHIKKYIFDTEKSLFSWTYSEKYVRHKDSKKENEQASEGIQ